MRKLLLITGAIFAFGVACASADPPPMIKTRLDHLSGTQWVVVL